MTCFTSLKRTIIFKIQPARFNGSGGLPPQNPSEPPPTARLGPSSMPRSILNVQNHGGSREFFKKPSSLSHLSQEKGVSQRIYSKLRQFQRVMEVEQASECPRLGQTTNISETAPAVPLWKPCCCSLE